MEKTADYANLKYGEMLKSFKTKDFAKALLFWQMAPYVLLYDAYRYLFRVSGGLTDDDGKNIEKIIRSGQRSGVKHMKITVTKEELAGMDIALKRMKSKSYYGVTIGKKSSGNYVIDVEYK